MINFGTQFTVLMVFLFQLGVFLVVMWFIFALLAMPIRSFWHAIKRLMDYKSY